MSALASDLQRYLALNYETIVEPDVTTNGEPWFMARHPELPGCMSDGATPEEAVENLADARELSIASLIEDGLPVPLPAR